MAEGQPCQTVHIPAGLPIDMAQRPELVQPGQANLRNENVRFTKRGGLGKRPGFTALSSARLDGSTRTTGYKLASYQNQALAIDGHLLDVWNEALAVWITRDRVSEAGVPQRAPLPYPNAFAAFADSAITTNGVLVCASAVLTQAFLGIHASVVDTQTSAVFRSEFLSVGVSPITLDDAGWVSVAAVGTSVVILYVPSGLTHEIQAIVLDCSSAAGVNAGWSAPVTIATDRRTLHAFDTFSFSTYLSLAYVQNATDNVVVMNLNAVAAVLVSTTIVSTAVPVAMSLGGLEGDTLWLSYGDATPQNQIVGLDPNTLAVTVTPASVLAASPQQHTIVATGVGTGTLLVVSGATGSIMMTAQDFHNSGGAVAAVGPSRAWPNIAFASKPISVDGRVFLVAAPQDRVAGGNTQQNVIVVDVTDDHALRPVATVAPRLSQLPGVVSNDFAPQHFVLQGVRRFSFVNFVQRTALDTSVGPTGPSIEAASVDFGDPKRFSTVEYNGNLSLAGGVLGVFDGEKQRESEFLTRPDPPVTALVGGAITDTDILYVAVFEGIDASGNVAWSAISDPSAPVSPAAQSVTLTLSQLLATARYDQAPSFATSGAIRIAVYRTASSTGNQIYYRVGEFTQINNTNSVSFTDSTPAADIIKNAQLYKQPGTPGTAQDRFCPPGLYSPVSYNGMLVGVGDDGYTVWFSSQQVLGEETWWNPIFSFPITDEGPITALAVMDGTLFVFKRRAIYEVTGAPPSDNGAQGGFNAPQLVSGNSGCREPRSIIDTNIGTFFLSDRGLELLVRGGQSTQWIGESVRDITDGWPVCTAATLDWTQERVRFEFSEQETSNQVSGTGRGLVFNLSTQSWESVDIRRGGAPAQSAAMLFVGGAWSYAWIDTSGIVWVEDLTTGLDGGLWVTSLFEVPYVKQGLQQQQLVHGGMILIETETPANLLIELADRYGDYDASFNKAWTDVQIAASATPRELEFRPLQQNWAFKTRVSDATPTSGDIGDGFGFTWIGLSFDISPDGADTKATPNIDTTVRR